MKNDAGDAKLSRLPENICTLEDIELCYKGIQEIYSVDEDGTWGDVIETYMHEAEPSYYYCQSCTDDWVINAVQSQEQAWELVKAHLK